MGGLLAMSQKELDKVKLLDQLNQKQLSQKEVAERLGLSTRQIRRLQKIYLQDGERGLISKKRNKPSALS